MPVIDSHSLAYKEDSNIYIYSGCDFCFYSMRLHLFSNFKICHASVELFYARAVIYAYILTNVQS